MASEPLDVSVRRHLTRQTRRFATGTSFARAAAVNFDAYVASLGPLPPLLTLVGLGDGSVLEALDRSGWRGRIIAFEPDTTMRGPRLEHPVYQSWVAAGRLRVIDGPEYRGAVDTCLAWSGVELKAVAEPTFANRFPQATRAALDAMLRAVRSVRANETSRQKHSEIYRRNTLMNAPVLAGEGDVAALGGQFGDVPVVIAAAGPSLDRLLDSLRSVQDQVMILSVDTALRPLLAAGVRPHLAVAVDPTPTNARHLTDLSRADSTWLIAEGSIDPHALTAFRGRIFGCRIGRHDPWPRLEERGLAIGELRAWGSVVTTAFDVALRMGATTIAFAGLDLAFSEGRPYCRGTAFEELWRRTADWGTPLGVQWDGAVSMWPVMSVPDVNGLDCRTAPHLLAFRDWLVEQAASVPNVRLINMTNAGILSGARIEQGALDEFAARGRVPDLRGRLASLWQPRTAAGHALRRMPGVDDAQATLSDASQSPPVLTWRQADPVTMPLVRMTIPRSRITPHGHGFTFTFRTRAGRRWMAHRLVGEPRLFEGDLELGCSITLDEITFQPRSANNPRFEGPPISVELPEDIANYERLPLDLVLEHGL